MFAVLNVFEFIIDYLKSMKNVLGYLGLILLFLVFPVVVSLVATFLISVKNFNELQVPLLTITSIFIPLLFNMLMIVQYSSDRTGQKIDTDNDEHLRNKLIYLGYISSTVSVTIFIGFVILIINILVVAFSIGSFYTTELLLFSLLTFWLLNILISLVRIYRLIRHDNKYLLGKIIK